MDKVYIYLLQAEGYKLKPFEEEKFKADTVICDFAFSSPDEAENFIHEWSNILIDEQGFLNQAGFEIQISTKQIQLYS